MRLETLVLAGMLMLAGPVAADGDELVTNWPAPPYWTAPVEKAGRSALAASTPLPFIALTPCRIIDTRGNAPMTGGYLPAATVRSYTVTGVCGIPANAAALSLNATVVHPTGPGFLTLYPQGGTFPPVSTLNYLGNDVIVNAAVVPLSATGGISMALGVSGGDVILDTNGYYAEIPGVKSLNAQTGDLSLVAGSNVTITPSGNTLTIASSGGGSGGGAPSGPAGGSLAGTYPNPALAANSVGSSQLANGTVVRSINGVSQDAVVLQGTGDVSVTTAGSTITIGAPSGSIVFGIPGDTTLIGAGFSEIGPTGVDFWTSTSTTNAPSARYEHTSVWTGSRMIVWGGISGNGYLDTGGRYDPITDSWSPMSTAEAPSARYSHTAVWAGSRMIVWGGRAGSSAFNTGGQYDPVKDSWSATSTANAPSARELHTAVWAGKKMIVWGGSSGSNLDTGGRYDPVSDSWSATSTANAPSARKRHTAVSAGLRMIVWGGFGNLGQVDTGGLYDAVNDSWSPTSTTNAPSGRDYHTAVWTGSQMIVWGGARNGGNHDTGGVYDPVGDAWSATSTTTAPSARGLHTCVWTGSRMIVWGGASFNALYNTGGQYDPAANSWSAMSTTNVPSARENHTAVWTGSRMVVWGGFGAADLSTGGQWYPLSVFRKN